MVMTCHPWSYFVHGVRTHVSVLVIVRLQTVREPARNVSKQQNHTVHSSGKLCKPGKVYGELVLARLAEYALVRNNTFDDTRRA